MKECMLKRVWSVSSWQRETKALMRIKQFMDLFDSWPVQGFDFRKYLQFTKVDTVLELDLLISIRSILLSDLYKDIVFGCHCTDAQQKCKAFAQHRRLSQTVVP